MTLDKFIQFIEDLIIEEWTGRIIIDFHKGSISKKIKKEIVKIVE